MLCEILATEPTVYPEFAQPAVVAKGFIEQLFRSLSLWLIRRGYPDRQDLSHGVDHDEALPSFGPASLVIPSFSCQARRSNGLTIDDGACRPTPAILPLTRKGPQSIMNPSNDPVPAPVCEDVVHRRVGREDGGR